MSVVPLYRSVCVCACEEVMPCRTDLCHSSFAAPLPQLRTAGRLAFSKPS